MRKSFVDALLKHIYDPRFIFLSGDLGYGALESLQAALSDRFINCGIAEQNMVSVAAGLAKSGMRPFVYSIAPFLYARAFEQIRNDICFHGLPVVLVGNGGGYGYGVMGGTHHALEDYGVLLTLPHIHCYVPAFDEQIEPMIDRMFKADHPSYLRLGLAESLDQDITKTRYIHQVYDGRGPTVLAVGPIAGGILNAIVAIPNTPRPSLWVASEFPFESFLPEVFTKDVDRSDHLIIIEEHVCHGSIGDSFPSRFLDQLGRIPKYIDHLHADPPPYKSYGSQKFHRAQCGLDIDNIMSVIHANGTRKD